jgi:hypothetical protein
MRADRPLIGAVLFLAVGFALIFGYCTGTTGMNIGFPVSGSSLQVAFTTYGLALIAIGLLLLIVAILAAVVGEIAGIGPVWHTSRRTEREQRLNRQQREDRVEANREFPE